MSKAMLIVWTKWDWGSSMVFQPCRGVQKADADAAQPRAHLAEGYQLLLATENRNRVVKLARKRSYVIFLSCIRVHVAGQRLTHEVWR